jgi:Tannase and feruloyl esterase
MALSRGCVVFLAAIAACLAASGCAGTGDLERVAGVDCASLIGVGVRPDQVSLPVAGIAISEAVSKPATGLSPAYCEVKGAIAPVDGVAPPILFQINLPESWNGKALQYGGGGLNGTLVTGLGPLRDQMPDTPTPLAQGYATFGTDAGHPDAKPDIQIFALNDEALQNHAYGAYKKTYDVAQALIRTRYGASPKRNYFFGGSEGGREALIGAQRFPSDYDGVVSTVPVASWTLLQLYGYDQWRLRQSGGVLARPQIELVASHVREACDKLDGLTDGVVSAYVACNGLPRLDRIACAGAAASPEPCLTAPQIALMRQMWSPFRIDFALANGVEDYPAFLHGGEAQPGGLEVPALANYAVGDVRYFIIRDPAFSGPLDLTAHRSRILQISHLMDATNPDLSAFRARGGKLIMKENSADYVQSAAAGFQYFDSVRRRMGEAATDSFVRMYVSVGTNHGGSGTRSDGGPVPDKVDLLAVLDDWVEERQAAPAQLELTGFAGASSRAVATLPMCAYPYYPHYVGPDPKAAASFECKVSNQ